MEYTYADVIIDPNDPRMEGAIGKQVYTASSPFVCVRKANRSGDYKELTRIVSDSPCPFITKNSSWTCIILKKEPTYAERQAEWIKENDVKTGDMVRAIRIWTNEEAEREGCVPRNNVSNDIVGSVGKIDEITGFGLSVDFGEDIWYCPYFVLEKIVEPKKKYVPFDLSDPEVRKSLRGRWIISKDEESPVENLIHQFAYFNSTHDWRLNGCSASYWFDNYTFDDGTPFGKEVEE